jgi:hypothetical protein
VNRTLSSMDWHVVRVWQSDLSTRVSTRKLRQLAKILSGGG